MRRTIILSIFNLVFAECYARRGGGRYRGPLPDGDEVGQGILYAIIFGIVAFIIFQIHTAYEKKAQNSNSSTAVGCLGTLAVGATIVCLLPLLIWVERIVNTLFAIGVVIFITVVAILIIWGWITKKK